MTATLSDLWRRYRALERERRRLVLEAAVLLGLTRCGLRVLPFATVRRILNSYSGRRRSGSRVPAVLVGWAVTAAGVAVQRRRACLVEALAADAMLRRHGYDPMLEFGVRSRTSRTAPLEGHAWVTCDGAIVVGDLETLPEYVAMSAPPLRSARAINPPSFPRG
jgi:hypothetical protein